MANHEALSRLRLGFKSRREHFTYIQSFIFEIRLLNYLSILLQANSKAEIVDSGRAVKSVETLEGEKER